MFLLTDSINKNTGHYHVKDVEKWASSNPVKLEYDTAYLLPPVICLLPPASFLLPPASCLLPLEIGKDGDAVCANFFQLC